MSAVEEKLNELKAFQEKWGSELLQQLGLMPGRALTVSFDSNVELNMSGSLEPFENGFYALRTDLNKQVEVVGTDIPNNLVLIESQDRHGVHVISRGLFESLYAYIDPRPVSVQARSLKE